MKCDRGEGSDDRAGLSSPARSDACRVRHSAAMVIMAATEVPHAAERAAPERPKEAEGANPRLQLQRFEGIEKIIVVGRAMDDEERSAAASFIYSGTQL